MHWYGGSMAEAVTLSKKRNAIFVVFVEDDNNPSKELASTIDDSVVVERLKDSNNFLAVKLKSGSENYTYFAQIYQFVPVPSLFFIGRNGIPLEVVCAGVEPHNLATRIDRILQEHRKEYTSDSVQPSTSSRDIKNETVNFLQTEATVATAQAEAKGPLAKAVKEAPTSTPDKNESTAQTPKSAPEPPKSPLEPPKSSPDALKSTSEAPKSTPSVDEEAESSGPAAKVQKKEHHDAPGYEVVCEGDVCVRKPRKGADGAGSSHESKPVPMEDSPSTEEKIEKAKELIEATRKEKAAKEKELEKQNELERRSVGQGVAELKKWQADQEMKQIQEDRKREKMENDLARQRVLEQIAQDRAERRAREAPPVRVEAPPARGEAPPTRGEPPAPREHATGQAGDCTRVLFKLLDGGSHVATFPSGAPLSAVRQYVTDHLQPDCPFSLWTAFPRRRLEDADASLLQLQLAPSAALLVLPAGAPATRPQPPAGLLAFLSTMFATLILNPTYQLYSWIRDRIFPPQPESSDADRARPPSPHRPDQTRPRPAGLRRRGNVHRLTGDGNNDDDNNTWNGNSTQQM